MLRQKTFFDWFDEEFIKYVKNAKTVKITLFKISISRKGIKFCSNNEEEEDIDECDILSHSCTIFPPTSCATSILRAIVYDSLWYIISDSLKMIF